MVAWTTSLSNENGHVVSVIALLLTSWCLKSSVSLSRGVPWKREKSIRVYVKARLSFFSPRVGARSARSGPRLSVVRTGTPRSMSKVKLETLEFSERKPRLEAMDVLRLSSPWSEEVVKCGSWLGKGGGVGWRWIPSGQRFLMVSLRSPARPASGPPRSERAPASSPSQSRRADNRRLGSPPPSGLVWLATWPGTQRAHPW